MASGVDAGARLVDVGEAHARWCSGPILETLHCFDVRADATTPPGGIPGFTQVSGGQLVQQLDEHVAVRDAGVLLASEDPVGGSITGYWLRRLGVDHVTVLAGGLPAWRASGLPWDPAPGARWRPGSRLRVAAQQWWPEPDARLLLTCADGQRSARCGRAAAARVRERPLAGRRPRGLAVVGRARRLRLGRSAPRAGRRPAPSDRGRCGGDATLPRLGEDAVTQLAGRPSRESEMTRIWISDVPSKISVRRASRQ